MYMAEGLDSGDMIAKKEVSILPDETAGELFDRLAPIGGELLCETLIALAEKTAKRLVLHRSCRHRCFNRRRKTRLHFMQS